MAIEMLYKQNILEGAELPERPEILVLLGVCTHLHWVYMFASMIEYSALTDHLISSEVC